MDKDSAVQAKRDAINLLKSNLENCTEFVHPDAAIFFLNEVANFLETGIVPEQEDD